MHAFSPKALSLYRYLTFTILSRGACQTVSEVITAIDRVEGALRAGVLFWEAGALWAVVAPRAHLAGVIGGCLYTVVARWTVIA